jgi:hypothetical protein
LPAPSGGEIELSPDGRIALEFYIALRDDWPVFGLPSEAMFLPEDGIDPGAFQCAKP